MATTTDDELPATPRHVRSRRLVSWRSRSWRDVGRRLRRDDPGLLAVLAVVALWCVVMYVQVWRRHDRYGTFDNDLGFHDQFVWLLARGKSFSSVLGLPAFGHNATFGYYLLAPLSRLGIGGPQWLDLVDTIAVGLGAVPLYLLARDRFGAGTAVDGDAAGSLRAASWKAAPIGLLWLLHPVVQGNVWETFHPDAIAMAPLLAAYLCASRRRWRWFGFWIVCALIWKSDVTLAVAVLGILIAVRWNRRVGLATLAVGIAWFALTVGWMIPHLSGGGTVFGPLYGDLGATPLDVASTAVHHPGKVAGRLWDHDPVRYSRDLLAPYGFLPVLGAAPLAVAAPQATVNLLSDRSFTYEWHDNPHYQAIPMVAMALALVEALAFIRRRKGDAWAGRATAFALATSLAATVAWGSLPPFATQFDHYWTAAGDPARAAKDAAIAAVPPDASVSAQYLLVPHLTHREQVYSFPNPWRQVFYGVEGTKLPDPRSVRYLVGDLNVLVDGPDRELWDCIMASGAYRTLSSDHGIVVARRRVATDDSDSGADLACR